MRVRSVEGLKVHCSNVFAVEQSRNFTKVINMVFGFDVHVIELHVIKMICRTAVYTGY